jgi:hypothetical protein
LQWEDSAKEAGKDNIFEPIRINLHDTEREDEESDKDYSDYTRAGSRYDDDNNDWQLHERT